MEHDNKTILIVEDETFVAEIVGRILDGHKVRIFKAVSIFDAETLLKKEKFDIIILDRLLPDGDGVELFRKLKTDPELKAIPVLILSGKTDEKDKVDGLDLGADDYMTKPFSAPELRARVDVLLRRAAKFVS